MKVLAASSLALALAVAAGSANANDYYDDRAYDTRGYDDRGYSDPYAGQAGYPGYSDQQDAAYDMARVLNVDPIVEPGRPVNRRECWREPVPVYANSYRRSPRPSGGGAVLGAIVGGVLGNTVGDGDGRQAATVAGAVIGGAIGHNMERNGREAEAARYGQAQYPPGEVERCRVVTDYRAEERVVGYRVAYEYAGRTWQTVTDYHPGSEIRVRVHVTPEG